MPKPEVRRRQWRLLRGVLERKKLAEIDRGLSKRSAQGDVVGVSARLKPENARRLALLVRENMARKFTPEKADRITALAKKIILGQAALPQVPQKARPILQGLPKKTADGILADLRETGKTQKDIAVAHGVKNGRVFKAYHKLLEDGENIPERNTGSYRKSRLRRTGAISGEKIPRILAKKEAQIVGKAKYVFWQNRRVFLATGMGPEDIAQYIRKSLVWKLETFDPARMKKAPPAEKLDRYISYHISRLASDTVKTAARKARHKTQLVQRFAAKDGRGEETTMADIPERASTTVQDPQETIDLLEEASWKARLLQQEKAAVFAKIVGISNKQFAAMAGVKEKQAFNIYASAMKKMANARIAPEIKKYLGG